MYLPFLRGKLYELKAIKEFVGESYGRDYGRHVMPIVEPVKKDLRPLVSCMEVMGGAKMPFAIVMNSRVGDFQRMSFDVESFVSNEKIKNINWTPAFEVNGDANIERIEQQIADYAFRDVMLIFFSTVDLDNVSIRRLVTSPAVKYVVAMNLTQRPPIITELKECGKELITLEDCFPEKTPNNAYRENIDEFFSDTFSYYKTLFGMFGFSDYTALARNFREGGVLPQVVAIHITYQKSEKIINVHHFLSESRNGSKNIREEFQEAKVKIAPFFRACQSTFAVNELIDSDYPGLGAIKKFSIKNHLELVSRILHVKEK